MNKKTFRLTLLIGLLALSVSSLADDIVPTGGSNNLLYYKIGGGSTAALPPVNDTDTINLNANANLGSGYACGAFNPVQSIVNSLKGIKDSTDNIDRDILLNATGSLAELPMYLLAQADPTMYNLINNALLGAHKKIDVATKNCADVKSDISSGQNPYHDWGTLAVGDQWKKHLSLTSTGSEDITAAKKQIDGTAGDDGVSWVNGIHEDGYSKASYRAGGLNQPPVHVIADTVKAGYNALLLRQDLNSDAPAPQGGELATDFPTPLDAQNWITNVVGDQTITTCNEDSCKNQQGGISGRGLLPWIGVCSDQNKSYCAANIRKNLSDLVTNNQSLTKDNLEAVSATGVVISPQVITAIRNMDPTQQGIVVTKLSQEVATQRVLDRAFLAKNILQTGSQVPVIAANQPAQRLINQALQHLDSDIQSLAFESRIHQQMMSNTVSDILQYQNSSEQNAAQLTPVAPKQPLMQNSALPSQGNNR